MKTNLLIVILLIFNITYSQTDTVKNNRSKVSLNIYYIGNIQTVDKNKYPDTRKPIYNYINGEEVYAGYYDTDYKTTFSSAVNINLFIKLYKNLALTTGINVFSEKIKYTVNSEYTSNYTISSYDIWSNTYLSVPIEFSYNLQFKGLGLYPYLGANFNALFLTTHETDYAPGEAESPYIEAYKRGVFHSRIFVGFVGGLAISKRIYKKLDLLLKMNYQPSLKVLLVNNTEVYSGVNTFGVGVGLNYNF